MIRDFPNVSVIGNIGAHLSTASFIAAELADEKSRTSFKLLGTSVELSGAGSKVGSGHGCTDRGGGEEGQGGDGSGRDGGKMHVDFDGVWTTGVLTMDYLVI